MKKNRKNRKNEGFTLIELLIVVAIIGIIAAIAVPGLLRARMSGNEASAIVTMRTVNSSQATYASSCGGGGYADDMASLAVAPPGAGAPAFITPDVSGAVGGAATKAPKSGYGFTLVGGASQVLATPCNSAGGGKASKADYFSTAEPVSQGTTGTRFFATDQSGQIRQDAAKALTKITDGIPLQ